MQSRGGGIQYAVTNNWSVRAEYRYTDFGRLNSLFDGSPAGAFLNGSHHLIQNQVQVGVSYKFDMWAPWAPGPVVAKY